MRSPAPRREVWPALRSERGQAIIVVALIFVLLLGFAGLAIDVSSAYSLRRFERTVADAAALAGAQDLQVPNTRSVTDTERTSARTHVLESLVSQLKATDAGTCDADLAADVINCPLPGTPYYVSIQTPSPTCVTCDPNHAVQVSISDQAFQTTFARLYGQATWNVGITSVAGLTFATKYAVITLQPPDLKPNRTDANLCKDLVVDGNGTVLNVLQGDVGTNTSANTTNAGLITLADGYFIEHYDDLTGAACGNGAPTGVTWTVDANGNPQGKLITSLVQDPAYPYAQFPMGATGAPTYQDENDVSAQILCSDPAVDFPQDAATIATLTPPAGGTLTCYRPGIYTDAFTVANKNVAYFSPGAYWFQGGLTVNSVLGGGLVDGHPGVLLRFPESGSSQQFLANNTNAMVLLNAGSDSCASGGCRATAATDFAGNLMVTQAGLVITVEVDRDAACFSGTEPEFIGCEGDLNTNKTVKLTAATLVRISGIIYGPSDNMQITGGSSQEGLVGQVVSWTVTYTGHASLNQSYPGGEAVGVLRLDSACSGPGTPCNP